MASETREDLAAAFALSSEDALERDRRFRAMLVALGFTITSDAYQGRGFLVRRCSADWEYSYARGHRFLYVAHLEEGRVWLAHGGSQNTGLGYPTIEALGKIVSFASEEPFSPEEPRLRGWVAKDAQNDPNKPEGHCCNARELAATGGCVNCGAPGPTA